MKQKCLIYKKIFTNGNIDRDKLWLCSARQFKTSINLDRLSVTRHLFCMITEGELGNIMWIAVPVVFS